ncbi:ribosome biogenesis/translation initiation ATPase RLI [Candidatus Woesearchaeota archaeon]|nr:ribosome biogenesis/translation initiation ATPase RLI [Candidatus Woesearchaeota archaeon]
MPRIAVVEKDKCHPDQCGGQPCMRFCPVNRGGEECITLPAGGKIVIDEELCTGCGICPKKCPFGAIHIINLPEELNQEPVHRFGQNEFRLYNLPTPVFGKVVGIIGRNGIGKSTAIKILAGVIKPNFGDWKRKDSSIDELIEFFRGREAQKYFEKVRDREIKIAYKPQNIDRIPKNARGKVGELLKKVDETGKFEEIAEMLDIKNILDNDIEKLSGGELQRVAIAATVLKKANVYIFDEPTSYLDIKQRIRVSRFIRNLANESTAVLVVEHDLIILDYLTDIVHLMYGKEVCYGITSQPKPTRVGINVYLEGFLHEENVRFRPNQITFSRRAPVRLMDAEAVVSWDKISKTLGKFSLEAAEGSLKRKSVVGILGENGIGKSTFLRILAGEEKGDEGSVGKGIQIAYKPQYIYTDSGELVAGFLGDALEKYDSQLIKPLELRMLLTKKLNELSGGELQRVMIAKTLSQDAKLYLLDEPSAYLDIEQRLVTSKLIRDFMEQSGKACLIVDHDLLLIDYLSDQLMIFLGQPAIKGRVTGPFEMEKGMNLFLQGLDITLRRDADSNRPRINKPESQKDREQKSGGKLYYT